MQSKGDLSLYKVSFANVGSR